MNSLVQYNSEKGEKVECQSKGIMHPCLGYHVPAHPVLIKKEFHSMTQEP